MTSHAIAMAATGIASGKLVYGGPNMIVLKDGINLGVASLLTSEVADLSAFIPIPGVISSIGQDLSTGAFYALVNSSVWNTSPQAGFMMRLFYGTGVSIIARNVVEPLVGDVEGFL